MFLIKDLLTTVNAAIVSKCTGSTWTNENGAAVAMQVTKYQRKQPTTSAGSPTDFPFVFSRHLSGVEGQDKASTVIRLVCGIYYKTGDIEDGEEDLDRLMALLLTLPTGQGFSPYSLEEIRYKKGAEEGGMYDEGRQPDATTQCYCTVDLIFIRETAFIEE